MRALFVVIICFVTAAAAPTPAIKVDQVGYLPYARKLAFVVTSDPAAEFVLRRIDDSAIVFRGSLSSPAYDSDSGDRLQLADFSKFQTAGRFYIEVPGVGNSWSFSIGRSVYNRAFYLTMRSFYGQRCRTAVALGPEFPGFKHDACHLASAYHPSSGRSGPHQSKGGWHDAGDYGRYVVNSSIATAELLWATELFGYNVNNLNLNLPESNNSTPDVLDEVRWNLDWMLTMQDTDGGVWPKQTSERFADFVMPENDPLMSYVIGTGKEPYKTSTATADFAAVMAIAARVYKPFDAAYARRCLKAAKKAWGWLGKNPNETFRNPAGVLTGEYGDRDPRDEILWAAAELWRTTKEKTYERYFLSRYREQLPAITAGPPSWSRVGSLALWTYVLDRGGRRNASAEITRLSLKTADEIMARTEKNGYSVGLRSTDYVWGSNGVVANYGVQLLIAYRILPERNYLHAALEHLHYLFGRNAFSRSWVTQLGENPFRHPHHRPSQADKNSEPWPGLLSGGPNRSRQDPAMTKLADLPPAKMYLDDWESYATNEIAINWNAPMVFVLAAFVAQN
jgi:endoglucanase